MLIEQYRSAEKLNTRISIHEKYSKNKQGFGNWILSHYKIEKGMSVLELGCGKGNMWLEKNDLISKCSKLILSDFSEGMLKQAKETLKNQKGIEFRIIDIQNIPFEANSFDIVIANMMLYHVPDIQKGLSEVRRVLKDNGSFYCATYGENGMMEYIGSLFKNYGVNDHPNHLFTLQNGEKQLSNFFSEIQRFNYEDSLEVTDLDDIADYIYSLAGMAELRKLPREALLSVLKEKVSNGILHIPKEYGMFISR